jgi:hypothetical protein
MKRALERAAAKKNGKVYLQDGSDNKGKTKKEDKSNKRAKLER